MLQDFRKHNLGANSVFKIRIKSEGFFCKLMAEEVFVFFNTQGSMSLQKLIDLRELEKISKSRAVLFEEVSLDDIAEDRDFKTIKVLFNSLIS